MLPFPECSYPFGSRSKEWEDFIEVHTIVGKLQAKQQGIYMSLDVHTIVGKLQTKQQGIYTSFFKQSVANITV